MDKVMYDTKDIAADLSVPETEAAGLIKELHSRMKRSGIYAISGLVPRAYYEKQKARGFLPELSEMPTGRIPLNEKRLLSIEEFCEYAGGIGTCTARKHAKQIGAEVRIGGRCLVDREKFDRWCDENKGSD